MGAVRGTPHLPQRLQEGQIRFARAVLLNALAMPEPQGRLASELGDKGIHQRGFANAGLARDEPQVALTLEGFGEPLVQGGDFGLPRHQMRCGRRGGHGRWGQGGSWAGAGRDARAPPDCCGGADSIRVTGAIKR